ncbi:deleted in malignant brain tumors 1 protein-like isoform X2 [Actinia tenebrosa]|nr:deleted in malignant brain tumors 1 protein-like isoform X2 [Actinia tenebrosa]
MLGFARAYITKRFGPGTGQIWLDDVSCKGTETSIDKCRHGGWGHHNCDHSEDIGVVCTNGTPNIAVRMANSSLPHAARIEIRYHGVWKSLCDGYWSLQDSHVVCRMFSYTDGAAFAIQGYQSTTGDAWDTQISCSGTETSIDKCKIRHWGESDCSSDYRAGVVCLSKGQVPNVAVRLVNGSTPNQGRLEVRYYGVWGTVCDDYWGISNAHVVCHMLNYSKALTTGTASKPWSGPILLDDVMCNGFEDSLENCQKRGWGQHDCYHGEDVEVTCEYGPRVYPNISVRLVNSSFPHAGQIEMRYFGVWKPFCDGSWTKKDANVACRMLGYSQGAALPVRGYQSTTGDAWETRITCRGTETSIEKCSNIYWKQSNCHDNNRAGVVCLTSGQDSNVAVRLVDGNKPNQGRVEVRYYGVWGTVCDDYWGINNAHVVCRMLNYSKALWTGGAKVKGSGPILLDNVYCSGYENSLESCWNVGWGEHNCGHYEDVGVTCANETKAQNPDVAVRLMNGSTRNEGRVEVRYYGLWGTVCDDRWGLADAHVVCRMLNYSKASWAGTAKIIGSGPIVLDEVQCRGNEKSIEYCPKDKWGWHNCLHSEDAGVKCEMLSKEEIKVTARLIGADHNHIGIVEVNYNGTWRPVCDDTWDILDAHVVCRMLGYKAALLGIKGYRVRKETGPWMGNVECSGNEKLISECYHRGWNNTWCPGKLYAGVMCNITNELPQAQVRLEEGNSPNSGRVAIRYGNLWGTICRDEIDINAARVMCRMLGYPGLHYKYNFKPGSGAIWLMSLECDGTEKSITDCRLGWGNATTCSHDRDVAIMCKKAEAPRFKINGTNGITDSTVIILFKRTQQSIGTQMKRVYQVAVEKRNLEKNLQSDGQTEPSAFIDDVNVTMKTSKVNNSYIAAEILGSSSSLKIGDGQYYRNYYNAPLEPGCQYRVYVRAVTKTVEKKPIYSDTTFVAFVTKRQAIANKATSGMLARRNSLEAAVIVLSIFICILILIGIGYYGWCYLRRKRAFQEKSKTEMSGQSQGNKLPETDNEPSTPHYQPLSYPSVQDNTMDEKQKPAKKLLKVVYRKKEPETSSASIVPERHEPSKSQSPYFPSDFSGIENQSFSLSDITLQELSPSQAEQES